VPVTESAHLLGSSVRALSAERRLGAANSGLSEAGDREQISQFWPSMGRLGRLGAGVAGEAGEGGRGLIRKRGGVSSKALVQETEPAPRRNRWATSW
jgi:hypothetical protein